MILHLYTQNKCGWCRKLEESLVEWGHEYEVFNISNDIYAKQFMRDKGHKTVPQLYYAGQDVMQGPSEKLTSGSLQDNIDRVEWPNVDSGIEGNL
jgi:glutaredoxin